MTSDQTVTNEQVTELDSVLENADVIIHKVTTQLINTPECTKKDTVVIPIDHNDIRQRIADFLVCDVTDLYVDSSDDQSVTIKSNNVTMNHCRIINDSHDNGFDYIKYVFHSDAPTDIFQMCDHLNCCTQNWFVLSYNIKMAREFVSESYHDRARFIISATKAKLIIPEEGGNSSKYIDNGHILQTKKLITMEFEPNDIISKCAVNPAHIVQFTAATNKLDKIQKYCIQCKTFVSINDDKVADITSTWESEGPLQQMIMVVIRQAIQLKLKRIGSDAYRRHPKIPTAYILYSTGEDFVNQLCRGLEGFLNPKSGLKQILSWWSTCDNVDFPFLKMDMSKIGYRNGVYELRTGAFTPTQAVASGTITGYKADVEYTPDLKNKPCPTWQKLLDDQLNRDLSMWLEILLGRMFFPRTWGFDWWQVAIYITNG